MTLTTELPPALEEWLKEESVHKGVPAEEYARKVLEERLLPNEIKPFWATATRQEWGKAFRKWVDSHGDLFAPPLFDEAISRGSIYGEREDRQL
jgi:hypothetical protein